MITSKYSDDENISVTVKDCPQSTMCSNIMSKNVKLEEGTNEGMLENMFPPNTLGG